jgi:hypothetical protein
MRYGKNLSICTDGNRVGYEHESAMRLPAPRESRAERDREFGPGETTESSPHVLLAGTVAEGNTRAVGTIENCPGRVDAFQAPLPGRAAESRRHPPVKLAGYCQLSLPDIALLAYRCASGMAFPRNRKRFEKEKRNGRGIFSAPVLPGDSNCSRVKSDPVRSIEHLPWEPAAF